MTHKKFHTTFTPSSSSSLFITAPWQQHTEMISHLGQFSQNILLVIAPPGGGKTSFLEHFLTEEVKGLRKFSVSANEETFEQIMKNIVEGFGLNWLGVAQAYEQIQDAIEESYVNEATTWMLLIDDAHLLEDEKLKSILKLIHFNDDPKKQLHLVFLGDPSLELRLFSPEIATCIHGKIYTIELESWTLNDIKTFLTKDPAIPKLNSEQLTGIFERSRGIPGGVLREKAQIFEKENSNMKSTLMGQNLFNKWHNRPILVGALIGLMVGGGYLLLNSALEEEGSGLPSNYAKLSDNDWETQHLSSSNAPTMYQEETTDMPLSFVENQKNLTERKVSAFNGSHAAENLTNTPAQTALGATENKKIEAKSTKVEVAKTEIGKPNLAKSKTLLVAASKKESPTIMAKSLKYTANAQDKKRKLSFEEEQLLSMDNQHYTLQLLGARNESSVKQFIQAHDIADNTHYFKTKLSGKDWYVVVYGSYPSKEEALSAIESMPYSLREQSAKPWVRELKSIQNDIHK